MSFVFELIILTITSSLIGYGILLVIQRIWKEK